jgi:S-adenosylmethionine-diacylglycerol 3-amino-3-carboxypropyl transferase
MNSEVQSKGNFSLIKYSQCWEDTNLVLNTLDIKPGDICLSIAAAGDNSLSLLTRSPKKVIAIDLNPCQLALLRLKVTAIKELDYDQFVTLFGYDQNKESRIGLYLKIENKLDSQTREFWSQNLSLINRGIADCGQLEYYFRLFRRRVLPLIHSRSLTRKLFTKRSKQKRADFFANRWNTTSWKLFSKLFFSRYSLEKFGRDQSFFDYAKTSLSSQIASRLVDALVNQDPAHNPYLHWILLGRYDFENNIVPHWLEPQNFQCIKANIDRLEIEQNSLEAYLSNYQGQAIDCFNLSDIFEYMSEENYSTCLELIASRANDGARLAYFNMLVDRMAHTSQFEECSIKESNQTFFYSRFISERIIRGRAA